MKWRVCLVSVKGIKFVVESLPTGGAPGFPDEFCRVLEGKDTTEQVNLDEIQRAGKERVLNTAGHRRGGD